MKFNFLGSSTKKSEVLLFTILIVISAFLRFPQLGYSHFYGDEAKILYLDKTIPALTFFMDQRKGPVEFLIAWAVEVFTGGFNEGNIRVPFVIAGFLSVLVFYFLVKELFDWKVSMVASYMFSLNGLIIAFSRTAQYQSVLILFGLLALYLYLLSSQYAKIKGVLLLISSLCLASSLLAHYDAVFFAVPIFLFILRDLATKKLKLTELLVYLFPLILFVGGFYSTYFTSGAFDKNTRGYIEKRMTGETYQANNSLYTLKVYNPIVLTFIPLFFILFTLTGTASFKKYIVMIWMLTAFFFFEFVIQNPGTHIYGYLIPLIILSSVGIFEFFKLTYKPTINVLLVSLLVVIFLAQFLSDATSFLPFIHSGYPWSSANIWPFKMSKPYKSQYHLYIYGYPYNRGWDQIKNYLAGVKGVRNYYTNDNTSVSAYYLNTYDLTPPGTNYLPQYFINVIDNQEFRTTDALFMSNYVKVKDFYFEGSLVSELYKLKN